MGQRKPCANSNTTSTTLNTDKYRKLENENPWKIFKSGALPIGLAEGYKEKNGYDPLRACRIYLWLTYIRGITWWSLILVTIGFLMILAERYDNRISPLLPIPTMCYFTAYMVGLILIIAFTNRPYRRNRRRMFSFQNDIEFFVRIFNSMLEDKSSGIEASTNREELLAIVSKEMIRVARTILESEIIGRQVEAERYDRLQKSAAANKFGLGQEWSIYFSEARKDLNAYELFTYQI